MQDNRPIRTCGSTLILGGTAYRLETLEGMGGSAIVYRASYPDSLSPGERHQVLIKELFPISPQGDITRGADGSILCAPEAEARMELARQRFLTGNQINLELLRLAPSATAGNLNSYEAYGTYYSVLSVHGGRNLLEELETRGRFSLRESVCIFRQILQALEVFHRRRLLHLDVSPDNILLLPGQVLLIDFNSAWELDNPNDEAFSFSCKQGYSAQEVLLQNESEIGPATDLYACCAVWFHLLTGRRLTEGEQAGNLRRSLPAALSSLENIPQTAVSKTAQILLHGLHPLARKRYQSIRELQADLEELLNRLDGFGVTRSALWETSAAQQRKLFHPGMGYLEQPVDGEGIAAREDLACKLEQGGQYLLTGPGGMGKSRLLMELWKETTTRYQPQKPVYLYLTLKDYQASDGGSHFIRESILRAMRFSPQQPHWRDALHRLELLFQQTGRDGGAALVLLLDGLNEAGQKREGLLLEIESLSRQVGVGILVTDRTDGVLAYGLTGFVPLRLLPLSIRQTEQQLALAGLALPQEENLQQLLTTPMLLFLYLEAAQLSSESSRDLTLPATEQELVQLYLERFCRQAVRADSGSQGRQLCSRYLFQHVLPDIAWEMRHRGKTILTTAELLTVSQKSHRVLHSVSFGAAFPDFLGKTRLMLEQIHSPSEWFDFAIREQLHDRFGLLVSTPQGQFSLLHDTFLAPLARQAEENRRRLARENLHRWSRRAFLLAAAGLALGGAAAGGWYFFCAPKNYTEEEKALLYDALASLNLSLSVWSSQISAQEKVLEQAAISDVLDNRDSGARDYLWQQMELQRRSLDALYAAPLDTALLEGLGEIAEKKNLFSLALFQQICSRHQELESITQYTISYLEDALCSEASPYNTRDKRERLVKACQDYLEAETQYLSYLLAALMAQMTPEQQGEVLEAMTYMEALDGFYDGPGSVDPARLQDGTNRALETLKDARREMNAQGFSIGWPASDQE